MRRFRSSDRLGGSTSVFRVVALPSRQLEARQRLFLEILAKQVSESGDSRRIAITLSAQPWTTLISAEQVCRSLAETLFFNKCFTIITSSVL